MTSLVVYLSKIGDSVTVVCDKPNLNNCNGNKTFVPQNITIERIDTYKKHDREKAKLYRKAIIELLKREKFDVAIVTVGPYYTLRFCYKLFKKYELRYLIDFRDVGAFEYIRKTDILHFSKIIISRICEAYFECRSIASASSVVSVTNGWMEKKKRDYFLYRKKMVCIENGYDEDRLKSITLSHNRQNYTIAIMGKLAYYSEHYARVFIKALKSILPLYDKAKLIHICEREETVDRLLNEVEIERKYYESTGFLDYAKGIQQLSNSNLFVIVDNRKDAMGTKIYDYLYLNRPILYVGEKKTTLARFVGQFENGFVCSTETEVTNAIIYIFNNNIDWLDKNYDRRLYSRNSQNKKYRFLLSRIIDE